MTDLVALLAADHGHTVLGFIRPQTRAPIISTRT
jgi:hypothetical protein